MRKSGSSVSVGLCLAFFAGQALAQDACETNDDCAVGMACDVIGSSGCPGAPDCAPGEDCPEVEPCQPEVFMGCVPGPCETDDDCGADMVCHTSTWASCSGSAGEICDDEGHCETVKEEPMCEMGSESRCVYRWQTSCEADDDCGAGFTCEQLEAQCDCAASGGSDPPVPADMPMQGGGSSDDPGTDEGEMRAAEELPEPVAPDMVGCDCGEPESIGYCIADAIECDSDADCPASWTCEADPEQSCGSGRPPTMGAAEEPPPAGGPAVDGGAAPPEAAEDDEAADALPIDDCVPVSSPMMCVPPGGYSGSDDSGGAPTSGGSSDEVGEGDDGSPAEPAGPRDDEDAVGEPPDDTATDEEPTADDDDEATDDDDEATDDEDDKDDEAPGNDGNGEGSNKKGVSSNDDGGCSVKAPGREQASALWLTGLFGLLLLRRRKQRDC